MIITAVMIMSMRTANRKRSATLAGLGGAAYFRNVPQLATISISPSDSILRSAAMTVPRATAYWVANSATAGRRSPGAHSSAASRARIADSTRLLGSCEVRLSPGGTRTMIATAVQPALTVYSSQSVYTVYSVRCTLAAWTSHANSTPSTPCSPTPRCCRTRLRSSCTCTGKGSPPPAPAGSKPGRPGPPVSCSPAGPACEHGQQSRAAGRLAVTVSGGRKLGSMSHQGCPRAGHRSGITAGRGGCCPGGTPIRPVNAVGCAAHAAAVRTGRRRRGCDQGRRACPGGVGQAGVRTGPGRRTVAVMRVRAAPPARPRAPGWTGSSRRQPLLWLGCGRAIPPPSARAGLAGHARPVQVVRPVGRSTCTGRAWPAPRRVADGDGMTRPGEKCAYAPSGKPPAGTGKGTGKQRRK